MAGGPPGRVQMPDLLPAARLNLDGEISAEAWKTEGVRVG